MIGVFDSGIGGLTVVHALKERLSEYDILYFGDTARTPYGNKSTKTVITYVLENIEFLFNNGAKIIVMACNTSASVAADYVRRQFKLPIFEVISPAVEVSLKTTKNFRVGVIGTRTTIDSGIYQKKIIEKNPQAKVYSVACPLLVPLVEEGWLKKPETAMIVKKYLHYLKVKRIDTLILGCTHYPILKRIIQQKIGTRVQIIDSSLVVADRIADHLQMHTELTDRLGKNQILRLIVSDITPHLEKTAQMTFKQNVRLEHKKF